MMVYNWVFELFPPTQLGSLERANLVLYHILLEIFLLSPAKLA
jgi:hypothetical protein